MLATIALYFGVVLVSLECVAADAYAETCKSNFIHLSAGRRPDAAYALFPAVPLFPIAGAACAWLLAEFMSLGRVGFLVVAFLGFFFIAVRVIHAMKVNLEIKEISVSGERTAKKVDAST